MKARNQIVKIILVILVVAAFFFVSEKFQQKDRKTFKVNSDEFIVVHSKKELQEQLWQETDQFFRYDQETLKMVDKYHLTTKIDSVSIPLLDEHRDFEINKVWNNGLRILVTYSFNLLSQDKSPDKIPYFTLDRLSFGAKGENPIELKVERPSEMNAYDWPNEGVVYQNRIYRQIWVEPKYDDQSVEQMKEWTADDKDQNVHPIEAVVEKVDQVIFQDIKLMQKFKNGGQVEIKDIPIDVKLMSNNTVLKEKELDKSIPLTDEIKLIYTKYERRLGEKRIYFKLNSPHIDFGELNFQTDGFSSSIPIQRDEKGNTFLQISMLNEIGEPIRDQVTMKMVSGTYSTNKDLRFTISNKEMSDFRHLIADQKGSGKDILYGINRELDEVNDIEFKLVSLKRKTEVPQDSNTGFVFMTKSKKMDVPLIFRDYLNYKTLIKEHPETDPRLKSNPMIEIVDQDGKPISVEVQMTDRVEGYRTQFVGLRTSQFEKAKALYVHIFNIPDKINFQDNEVTFKLDD